LEDLLEHAKMLPECPTSRQYLRYRKEADSKFHRAFKALKATLKDDAEVAGKPRKEGSADSKGAGAVVPPPVAMAVEPSPHPEADAAIIVATVSPGPVDPAKT